MNEQTRGYNFDDDSAFQEELPGTKTEATAEEAMPELESVHKAKSPIIYYALIGVVVLFALFLFYKVFFAGHNQPAPAPQTQNFGLQANPVPMSQSTASAPSAVSASPAPAGGNYVMMQRSDLKTLLDGIGQMMAQNTQVVATQLNRIESAAQATSSDDRQQLQALQTNMQQLNAKFNTYNQNLAKINKTLGETQSQLQLILAQTAQDATKLSLRAVVPGRAWLVDDKGITTTVIVGTVLPYYGKVINIDADAGKVTMSSGFVFQ